MSQERPGSHPSESVPTPEIAAEMQKLDVAAREVADKLKNADLEAMSVSEKIGLANKCELILALITVVAGSVGWGIGVEKEIAQFHPQNIKEFIAATMPISSFPLEAFTRNSIRRHCRFRAPSASKSTSLTNPTRASVATDTSRSRPIRFSSAHIQNSFLVSAP